MFERNTSTKKAFTLTELLVGLVLLGLIASFAVPYIVISAERIQKRALFKEAYHALAEATHATMLEGGRNWEIITKLNPQKICMENARTQGCTTSDHFESEQQGVVLASGVSLFGFGDEATHGDILADGVIMGLEEFPKKEYFYFVVNKSDRSFSTTGFLDGIFSSGMTRVDTIVSPGEMKCMEQACLDMLKND